ncbi:LCP family protein [Paenibacillus beijingensis]|uniref:Transcriptional regulator n=1 Tax=Paenibacillus beijingensis TaxID=1126833 RepID=A0A0D5NGV5_9BACL|nr:LCP family protein [Paenibacillus beijingensis]AJY74370.1 transcriptional regulator [Paenibacillus beijingensis]
MRSKPKTSKKRPWLWGIAGILVILIGCGAYYSYNVYNALDGLNKTGKEESRFTEFQETETEKPPEWTGKERVNILLMGGDGRGLEKNQVARSDSMLVVSIDPVTKKAHLFSVLRDTFVDVEGYGTNRINAAVALGGPNVAMKTIGDLLGLHIQYYVYTEFEGFKSLVDAIGGIDFNVEKDMNYVDNADGNRYDIHLKQGFQHLDGDKALQYVRFRHDAMSDFTRTERQRDFMKAVADKMKSTWSIANMAEIINAVSPYIETNLSIGDMLKLSSLGLNIQMSGSAQVPPMQLIGDEKVGGASVLAVRDEEKLHQYVQETLTEDSTQMAGTDGSGSSGADKSGGSGASGASGTTGSAGNGTNSAGSGSTQ